MRGHIGSGSTCCSTRTLSSSTETDDLVEAQLAPYEFVLSYDSKEADLDVTSVGPRPHQRTVCAVWINVGEDLDTEVLLTGDDDAPYDEDSGGGEDFAKLSPAEFRDIHAERHAILHALDEDGDLNICVGSYCIRNGFFWIDKYHALSRKGFQSIFLDHFDELNNRIVWNEEHAYEHAVDFLDSLENPEDGAYNPWDAVGEAGHIDALEEAWDHDLKREQYFHSIMQKWPQLQETYPRLMEMFGDSLNDD